MADSQASEATPQAKASAPLVTSQMLEHGAQELNGYVDRTYASREMIAERVFLAMLAVQPTPDPDNTMTPEFILALQELRRQPG